MDPKQLQDLIRTFQHQLNWPFATLVEVLYVELYDDDSKDKLSKFHQSLKKQLQRQTTPKEKLERYLQIIKQHPDFKKLDLVHHPYIKSDGVISETVAAGIKNISISLDNKFLEDESSTQYDEL